MHDAAQDSIRPTNNLLAVILGLLALASMCGL